MKRLAVLLAICTLFAAAQQGPSIQVQIHYTGTGAVDASHKIYVALWESDNFNGGPPVDVKSTDSKNGTVTFTNVKKTPAFVSSAYDPTGKWDGASGPPPKDAILGMYGKTPGKPDPITPSAGKPAKIAITFDDKTKAQ